MRHPGWKLAFGFVAASICLAAAPRTKAAPYYTATYVGTIQEIDPNYPSDGWNPNSRDGWVKNTTTGVAYPYPTSPGIDVNSQPAGFFDGLPTSQVEQGSFIKILKTYTMKPYEMNSSGVVLGTMTFSPGFNPEVYPDYGYTVKQADGTFSGFTGLAPFGTYHRTPDLTGADQIFIMNDSGWKLYDVKTGVETALRDLVPPELLEKYENLEFLGGDDRGDILVQFYNSDSLFDMTDTPVYILTPPGLDAPAPVPEPSVLWFAAAAVAGLGFRARRRRDG